MPMTSNSSWVLMLPPMQTHFLLLSPWNVCPTSYLSPSPLLSMRTPDPKKLLRFSFSTQAATFKVSPTPPHPTSLFFLLRKIQFLNIQFMNIDFLELEYFQEGYRPLRFSKNMSPKAACLLRLNPRGTSSMSLTDSLKNLMFFVLWVTLVLFA